MSRLWLRARARQDLREIAQYTEQVWGRPKRDAYMRAIDARLSFLAAYPNRAAPCAELGGDWVSLRAGRHIIFALRRDGGVEVVRVLHESQDAPTRLGSEASDID